MNVIEKTLPGIAPHPTITAPQRLPLDHHDEDLRLATFAQSEATRGGVVAAFPMIDTHH